MTASPDLVFSDQALPPLQVPDWARTHPAWHRLQGQLAWYDKKSLHCQQMYKRLQASQIGLAILIPVLSFLPSGCAKWATAVAGAAIALLEALQHMNQYSMLWIAYRSTAEHLKHEMYLFLSLAGPYRGFSEEERLIELAERIEEHVSTEHANWFNETRRALTSPKKEKA